MLPQIWDLLTAFRLVFVLAGVAAWLFVGWYAAPWFGARFEAATSGYVRWMQGQFDRMFLQIPASWCVAAIVGSVLAFGTAGWFLTTGIPYTPWGYHVIRVMVIGVLIVGPFGLPVGYQLPRYVVETMWDNRIARFEDQLLDALAFMSNGLKSGLSLLQAMDMVREELPDPISQEFALMLNEQRLGVPLEDALLALEKRIGTEDIQIIVTSINILRQSGGNLSETFDTVAHTIRERKKVQGRIQSLTAQGIAQGVIIVFMPFVLAFILWMMDPQLISRLWTTWLGWVFIFVMLTLQAVGAWMIKRIVKVQV
ncbi:MAG: type II secretion system F family protein [Pseudomonadota bacterium]|nr:type II secretion system F family protein [Pseudomonadota bacterium]